MADLHLLALNLTRRCNLACAHCYLDANTLRAGAPGELTTAEVCTLLDQIAARTTDPLIVLTGGEPLVRRDIEAIAAHATGLGLMTVVGTNGVLLDERRVASLQAAGVRGVGISVDSLDPGYHDRFRGLPGAWGRTLAGIEACRRAGLPFQVHFSVTEANAAEIPAMIAFAREVGAHVLNIFFLVCTGRGERMTDIAPATYERVITQLVEAQEQSRDLLIRARCAPYYKRIAYQRDPASPLTRAAGYEGGGCMAGISYCRITPEGGVTACPYIPAEEGNIRQTPFWDIWERAPTFARLRAPELGGKCGECEFRLLCGGCRARPLAAGGDLLDEDPWCAFEPTGAPVVQPLAATGSGIRWSAAAEQRLQRVPAFVRRLVRQRAEDYVRSLGASEVLPEHLAVLAARRFPNGAPK